ncbi:MAG: sigma-54-dependent Fis family transcriptional regulator [Novosphingobium pentaromativorans]|uniref:Sigma-54-dependent Fis family transcriptional regulator n=1 Tax=Novosphingobium pentaromativorans TaxID=205844 RepID=A0A2W5NMD6_9SPHN|nr:sigma-54 dependent transcriptional regulator [Novosphingobium panipatense]PZQ53389.1 MAG: sigma-54-dependent Fis family transcriptional regulator [Novosphingobium pentaromativorans]
MTEPLPEIRRVAVIDDDEDMRDAMSQTLTLAGYEVMSFHDPRAALKAIDASFRGVVVSDVRMPHMSGIELFRAIAAMDAELPVILVTGHGDVPMAITALKGGAWDFLTKPFDPDGLVASVGRAAEKRALVLENRLLRQMVSEPTSPLIGNFPAIVRLRATIESLAATDIDVLIEGETGTGKELVARMIHKRSLRARQRFVTIACGALSDAIARPMLHGGLRSGHGPVDGKLLQAHDGTLFLDDVDQAGDTLQANLVQFMEDRVVLPEGAREPQPVDVRVIACMRENVGEMQVQPALLYRLAAIRLRIPPLRERREDVPLIFAHLLEAAASRLRRDVPVIDRQTWARLVDHDWPGNVRELAHFAERVVLGLEDSSTAGQARLPLNQQMDAFERSILVEAIRVAGGNISKAMADLGLARKTFYYKVARHGLDLDEIRRSLSS